jgi:outer membrane protein assembly factor BamB
MRLVALVLVLGWLGCATDAAFSPHFRDNSAGDLAKVLPRITGPAQPGIVNATGKPTVYLVAAQPAKQLHAIDLTTGQPLWTQPADVTSRVVVAPAVVLAREGKDDLVARDVRTGAVAWRAHIDGKLVGVAVDGSHAYYVAHGAEGRRSGNVVALDLGSGGEKWRREAQGSLGAPAARSGLVFVPFMSQWLAILDGMDGTELARVRSTEEQVTFVRAAPEGVFYGGAGIFALTDHSVAGSRKGSTYGIAKFPGELVRPVYAFDAYSPAQADYSAVDRNRVLWRARSQDGALAFDGGQTVLHTYRFFFGIDAGTGALRWAYDHPRVDVVSSEHAGPAIFLAAQDGELEALDAGTGARLWQARPTATGLRVAGATFDVQGYAPPASTAARPPLAQTLTRIIWDPDRRFGPVKLFAIEALARLPDPEVGKGLVEILTREGLGPQIYAKAGEALVGRKDKEAVPAIVAELSARYDFVKDKRPRATAELARALAAAGASDTWPVLADKMRDPAVPPVGIRELAAAIGKLHATAAVPALREFLLMYRADPAFASDPEPLCAVAEALGALGGPKEREVLKYVAEEPRSLDKLATYVRHELDQTRGSTTAKGKAK